MEDKTTEKTTQPSVARPWGIYLVSVWCFFGIGNTIGDYTYKLANLLIKDQMIALIAGIAVTYTIIIVLIVGMIRLRRFFLIAAGYLFTAVAALSLISAVGLSQIAPDPKAFFVVTFFVVALSIVSAWYCLRPSFLQTADRFVAAKLAKPEGA